jgi:alkylation response protein AidB-like acyl-CoA dehydrogenase
VRPLPVTSGDEIAQLCEAVSGMLGIPAGEAPPRPAPDWRAGWAALAEVGLPALCAAVERDGFGLQADAAAAVACRLGAGVHGSPFAGLTAAAHTLSEAGDGLLDGVLSGAAICAFGVLDPTGVARDVDGASDADAFLLFDPDGGDVLVLDTPGGWTVEARRAVFDVTRSAGDVTPRPGAGRRIEAAPAALPLFRLLIAADALGCVQRTLDRTVAYAGQRVAFGKPIGGFQAVQHRLADHAVRVRGMSLLVADAASRLTVGAGTAHRQITLAELSVSGSATRIIHDLLQLTGGIGFTWEHGLHLHERRAHQDARLAANPRSAARSVACVEGWVG